MLDELKRTWAEIDLEAILQNYYEINRHIPAGTGFCAIVKADAYGHGAVEVSRLMEKAGARYLAVSCLDEAMELRRAGIKMPILILGHTPADFTAQLIDNDITQTITCEAKAIEYSQAAAAHGGTLRVHIKVDTGMGRLGFLCIHGRDEDCVNNIVHSCTLPNLEAEGIYTHFSSSDAPDPHLSMDYTQFQFGMFMKVVNGAEELLGRRFPIRHCANSGAVVNYEETALDMVRPGLLLYGYGGGDKLDLIPAMSLVTRISTIKHHEYGTPISYGGSFITDRHTRVGVLPIGYADGLMRCLSGKCSFMVDGSPAPQIGRICMDMCMIDLTDLPDSGLQSRVEIFGEQASLETLCDAAGTIPYEIMSTVTKRVPRLYFKAYSLEGRAE